MFLINILLIKFAVPHHCAVKGCHNSSRNKNQKVSFHSLPISRPKILQRWLSKLKHQVHINKHTKIYSVHFEVEKGREKMI